MAARVWPDQELAAHLLLALAVDAAGEAPRALDLLREALSMAEPGGAVRPFVDEGPAMARLLRGAQAAGISPGQVRLLIAGFPATQPGQVPSRPASGAGSRLAEPLSRRELGLLPLIAEGLTNQEIADRLFLSLYTVKAHARTIYAKLGVTSRTQAAAKARALGLLPRDGRPGGAP